MGSPNYGLQMALNQMQLPQKNNPILQEVINYQGAKRDSDKAGADLALSRAHEKLYGAQGAKAEKEVEYMPQQMELDRRKAEAQIAASNAGTAAAYSGIQSQRLQQQMMQYDMNLKKYGAINELTAGVKNADPTQKEAAYNFALNQAKQLGVDTSTLPPKWGPEAETFVNNAYITSGRQAQEAKAQLEAAKAPVETIIDQKTGQPVIVRRDQAIGQTPANAKIGQQVMQQENTLRNEWTNLNQNYMKVRDAYSNVKAMSELGTPAGDISMIFGYMKMLDPTSVVREGEFATAQNAAGIPDRIRNQYNKAMEGTRLTKGQRDDFVKAGKSLFESQSENIDKSKNQYKNIIKNQGLNEENVLIDYGVNEDSKKNNALSDNTKSIAAGNIVTGADGKQYQKVEGGYIPVN